MKELIRALKALANERRLQILKLLIKSGSSTVGEISDSINLSFRSTSKHLLKLESVNLVDKEQVGPRVFYKVAKGIEGFREALINLVKSA